MGWYQEYLVDTGRAAAVWALLGFLIAFAVTRGITRRIRARQQQPDPDEGPGRGGGLADIYIGGVHVHHQVWGIVLVLLCGLLEFRFDPQSPWTEVLAAGFGIGAALVLDEFALLFHLDDVYWGADGRKSIDAILVGAALGAVLLMETSPIGSENDGELNSWLYLLVVLVHLASAAFCVVKGKLATGLIGIVVPVVATVGAIRLAKPASVWARRRYGERKTARARRRFGSRYQQRRERIRDLLGGKLSITGPAGSEREPHQ